MQMIFAQNYKDGFHVLPYDVATTKQYFASFMQNIISTDFCLIKYRDLESSNGKRYLVFTSYTLHPTATITR
jgi:hypothetical protein